MNGSRVFLISTTSFSLDLLILHNNLIRALIICIMTKKYWTLWCDWDSGFELLLLLKDIMCYTVVYNIVSVFLYQLADKFFRHFANIHDQAVKHFNWWSDYFTSKTSLNEKFEPKILEQLLTATLSFLLVSCFIIMNFQNRALSERTSN